jgi:hypothetical protein
MALDEKRQEKTTNKHWNVSLLLNYLFTAGNRVLLEKLTGSQVVKYSLHFMEPKVSLPHSQVLASFPYQHGMVHPQVVEGGAASNMEGSCEFIKQIDADSRQVVVFHLEFWTRC